MLMNCADELVLEREDRRSDPAQRHGDLVHGRRADDHPERGAVRQLRHARRGLPGARRVRSSGSTAPSWRSTSCSWSTAGTTTETGYVDEGFDGVDNNGDGVIDDLGEWEVETWGSAAIESSTVNHPYTLARRPVPSSGTSDVALPSGVVIDLSTWGTTRERSRLPVNALSGAVEILLTPRGDVVPTTIYSVADEHGDVERPVPLLDCRPVRPVRTRPEVVSPAPLARRAWPRTPSAASSRARRRSSP